MMKTTDLPERYRLREQLHRVHDEALAICKACDGRNCPNVTHCCGGKRILTIRVPCPRNLWSMVKE